jgi:hypothetical protein
MSINFDELFEGEWVNAWVGGYDWPCQTCGAPVALFAWEFGHVLCYVFSDVVSDFVYVLNVGYVCESESVRLYMIDFFVVLRDTTEI